MGEFDQGDLAHCRRSYWTARADWHKILIDCYNAALERHSAASADVAATAAPWPARPAPVVRAVRAPAQGCQHDQSRRTP
jgi:hypothetical protein